MKEYDELFADVRERIESKAKKVYCHKEFDCEAYGLATCTPSLELIKDTETETQELIDAIKWIL